MKLMMTMCFGDDKFKPTFSSSKTWSQTCTHHQSVNWSKIVWFPQKIFINCLTFKDRLSTGKQPRMLLGWNPYFPSLWWAKQNSRPFIPHISLLIYSLDWASRLYISWDRKPIQTGSSQSPLSSCSSLTATTSASSTFPSKPRYTMYGEKGTLRNISMNTTQPITWCTSSTRLSGTVS